VFHALGVQVDDECYYCNVNRSRSLWCWWNEEFCNTLMY